ncbi:2Fe-2S iron-sulfur cluster-binding protein [Pseudoalteromonas sp. SSDWG2]|uniref:2Fe-2S iron-sulfur cluster-binding protein n=1 Tax=Pseudoalteromonas sp. SSDWG2 TaxID=3139391 RepID=UPI003BAB4C04
MQWVRTIHKWTSAVIGIQFMLWLISGIYFNVMDHHKVGGHTYRAHAHHETNIDVSALVEPREILANANASVSLKQIELLGNPYYLLTHKLGLYAYFENDYSLFDAYTGNEVRIDKAFATRLAKQSYNGPGSVMDVTLLQPPLEDFPKQKNATWRVNFDDDIQTSVYIEDYTGRVVGHSDAHKRFADIFFMLHFMDYGNEGSFNNIQIIVFAFVTLWLSLTGLIWTVDLIRRGQYKVAVLSKRSAIKLFDHQQQLIDKVELSTASNLLDGLAEHRIALPSTCGGGGTCGRCKVLINPAPKVTSADQEHFTESELNQGFRLACQHFSDDVEDMTIFDVTEAKKVELTLVGSEFVSPDIKELRFKVQGPPLAYKAGAFMRFFIPQGQAQARPADIPAEYLAHWDDTQEQEFPRPACSRNYSLTSVSERDDELVFAIKYQQAPAGHLPVGFGSSYLCNLGIGDTVDALGPFEEFYVDDERFAPIIVIGAGSGMAPLRAIINDLLLIRNSKQVIHFYFGARHEEDLLYQEEFFDLSQRYENFRFTPVLSQANADWLGATGYAQQVLFDNVDKDTLKGAHYYMCGPKAMMDQTIEKLVEMGVSADVIHFDSFS